jgi:hypothetical protein
MKILAISPWQLFRAGVRTGRSLKESRACGIQSQSNVREPGENPGRLRHCQEIQTPTARQQKLTAAEATD